MIKLQNSHHLVMVDDSEIDILLMQRCVNRSEIENIFLSFNSGKEFLSYMEDVKNEKVPIPALVFLDINMSGMNGFEVLETLRSETGFDRFPQVIFLTNSDSPEDIKRCQSLNADMQEKFSDTNECVKFLNKLQP